MTHAAWSLRNRLIALLATLAFVGWGTSSVWLYRSAYQEASELFDAALIETAHAVFAIIAHEALAEDEHVELEAVDHAHAERLFYQVRNGRGALVALSPGAPNEPLADANAHGFTEQVADGARYRVYTLREPSGRAAIHVGQPLAEREQLARKMALRLLLPGVVLVVLLAAGVWIIVRRVTSPLIAFSTAIDARAPSDTGAVHVERLPAELLPVGQAVNRLLGRVESALMHERTLTADAAHELRTPLAALRAQAQVALRARRDDERNTALRELIGGVDRATHLVETVLMLARLDAREVDRSALPAVALDRLVANVVDEVQAATAVRELRVEVDVPPLALRADAEALRVALRNLCENASQHAATRFRIEARADSDAVVIAVRDDGPGMTPAEQERAFDRFYRGSAGGAGTGLGLALVKRAAEMHAGDVRIGAGLDGRGVGVELVLPRGVAMPKTKGD